MSLLVPRVSTLGGGAETVHIIPLEEEIDRAVRVFEASGGFKANRVYLLAWTLPRVEIDELVSLADYPRAVTERLEAQGIEVRLVHTNIFELLDIISKVSSIVRDETGKGNTVYVNMSAGGPFVSVGTAIAAMVQDARLYYVRCQRYTRTREEKIAHGNAIVTEPQVHFLENFKIMLPDERGMKVLVELYRRGDMRTSDLLEFLHVEGIEGFEDDPSKLNRGEKITLLMRLNKGITGKLEAAGYIHKLKKGRENIYSITESGKYAACVSGLLGDSSESLPMIG
jgi:hypothetical protein